MSADIIFHIDRPNLTADSTARTVPLLYSPKRFYLLPIKRRRRWFTTWGGRCMAVNSIYSYMASFDERAQFLNVKERAVCKISAKFFFFENIIFCVKFNVVRMSRPWLCSHAREIRFSITLFHTSGWTRWMAIVIFTLSASIIRRLFTYVPTI